jgi:hypothetical protein
MNTHEPTGGRNAEPTADHTDALDRRIAAALRRRYEPPASLADLPARALATRRRRRVVPWLVLAACAAAALALLDPWRTRVAPKPRAERFARLAPLTPRPFACQPSGPLETPTGEPEQVRSPDLVQLYAAMDACQRSTEALPCRENSELNERLAAIWGDEIALKPDAIGFLQGPFASAEWPTATILTGTSGQHTSVLVAERDATLDCCVCMELPADSGLRVFTWQKGDLVLAEITPLDEPSLLAYLE